MMRYRLRTLILLTTAVAIALAGYRIWTGPSLEDRLETAALAGDRWRFEWLIWLGAEVHTGGWSYWGTPMMMAAHDGNLLAVKLYVEHGADVDCNDKDGFSAISYTAKNGHWEIVKYLLQQGACFRVPDGYGYSAIDYVANADQRDVIAIMHANPTPLSFWTIRIFDEDRVIQRDDGDYNRTYRLDYEPAGADNTIWAKHFRALVDREAKPEKTIEGVAELDIAPDGNSIWVTDAEGNRQRQLL